MDNKPLEKDYLTLALQVAFHRNVILRSENSYDERKELG